MGSDGGGMGSDGLKVVFKEVVREWIFWARLNARQERRRILTFRCPKDQ